MQIPGINLLKSELIQKEKKELVELCLRLAKYKQENKEFLGYLLFDAQDHDEYIKLIKLDMDDEFEMINTSSFYYVKKSVRKILRSVKKYVKFSKDSEVEVSLLMYWCEKMNEIAPSIHDHAALANLYERQITAIEKAISKLNEDLQYDYSIELNKIK